MNQIGKYLLIAGVVIAAAGAVLVLAGNRLHWIGRLPGDIRIEKDHFRLYIPITTMILASVVISLAVKAFFHFTGKR